LGRRRLLRKNKIKSPLTLFQGKGGRLPYSKAEKTSAFVFMREAEGDSAIPLSFFCFDLNL